MRPPHYVKLYVHNAKIPHAYQISRLRKGLTPNRYSFYSYLMHAGHSPVPKTQAYAKSNLRMLRSIYPL